MNRNVLKTLRATCLGILVTGALAACSKQNAKPAAPPPPEVSVVEAETETIPLTTELPGRVTPMREAQVRARATGILLKRLFEEGANVKEGDVLFEIDPAPLQAALNSAKADYAKTEAALKESQAKLNRYKGLVEINAVSKQVFDEALAAARQDEAELQANKAAIETAELNLGYTKVTAPISGRIGKALVTEGALVSATEATQLAVIRQMDPVYVDIMQSSADLLRLRKSLKRGQNSNSKGAEETPVTILLEDGSKYAHQGKLLFADVSVDPGTGMITLRAQVPNPDNLLLPGTFVRALVVQGVIQDAVTIPQRTVTRGQAGSTSLLVVNKDNKVEARKITVEREIGSKVVVAAGLQPGERVIVEGLQKAHPGSEVRPVPFTPHAEGNGKEAAKPGAAQH